jgi:hypothetical protein
VEALPLPMPAVVAWGPAGLFQIPSGRIVWGFQFELVKGGSGWSAQERERGIVGIAAEVVASNPATTSYQVPAGEKPFIYAVAPSSPQSLAPWFNDIDHSYREQMVKLGFI